MKVEIKYSDEFERTKADLEQKINDRIQEISNALKDPNGNVLRSEHEVRQIIQEMKEEPVLLALQEQLVQLLIKAVPEKIIIRDEQKTP